MIILNKVNPKAKILEWKPVPAFRTRYEADKYRAEMNKIYIEGLLDGEIPGPLCHFIQEQQILNRTVGEMQRPVCRDVELMAFQKIRDAKKRGRNINFIVSRGSGAGGWGNSLLHYNMRFMPGVHQNYVTHDASMLSNFYSNKFLAVDRTYEDYYHMRVRNKNVKANEINYTGYVRGLWRSPMDAHEYLSTVNFRKCSTLNSIEQFKSKGYIFGFYDQLALHPLKTDLLNNTIECYQDTMTKEMAGMIFTASTIEGFLDPVQLAEFRNIILAEERYKMDSVFIPFWMGSFLDENGWSDEKRAMEWHDRECNSRAHDPVQLRAFKKNFAKCLEDVFAD